MKSDNAQELDALFIHYNESLPAPDDAALERAFEKAGARSRRFRPGRTVALVAACAALFTMTVFAEDIVEQVRELYNVRAGELRVSVVDEISSTPGHEIRESASLYGLSNLRRIGGMGGYALGRASRLFTRLEDAQHSVPYPLPLPNFAPEVTPFLVTVYELEPGYSERAWLYYTGPEEESHSLVIEYVGPGAYIDMSSTYGYQVVSVLGVDVIWADASYPAGTPENPRYVPQLVLHVLCNRLKLTLNFDLTYDEALPLVEEVVKQALAIDWEVIKADLDNGWQPALAEAEPLAYPPLTLEGHGFQAVNGTTYRTADGLTATLLQHYRGPDYRGFTISDEGTDWTMLALAHTRTLELDGADGRWVDLSLYPHLLETGSEGTSFRFLCNRLEISLTLPMGYDEALPIVQQVVQDALSIDWGAA